MNKPYWTTARRSRPQMKAEYGMSIEMGPSNWRRARLILDGKEGETAEQLLDRTADTVEGWFNRRHSAGPTLEQLNAVSPYPITPVIATERSIPEEQKQARLLADILDCTELAKPHGLLSFEDFVKRENKPDITAAYNIMLKKLSALQ